MVVSPFLKGRFTLNLIVVDILCLGGAIFTSTNKVGGIYVSTRLLCLVGWLETICDGDDSTDFDKFSFLNRFGSMLLKG